MCPPACSPARAATHLHVISGNGGVSDDPAFPAAWDQLAGGVNSCRIDRDAPDAVYTSAEGFQYYYGVFPLRRAGLLHFDVSGIPAGRRVRSARLHLKTWWLGMSPNPARPDSLFACADTSTSDARWVGANRATWSEPREGESGPWQPDLASRLNYRQFGIVSRPWLTPVAAGQNQPGGGWWSLDVTRGVQAWVNGSPNAGFWLFGRAWYDKNASAYWSQAVDPALRPWLEITWDDEPYAGPWPDGRQVAFTLSTDDGFRRDNLAWASALDSLGCHFTIAVVDSFIKTSVPGPGEKLNDRDLAGLAAAGHEIASHTVTHREWNPLTVPDSVVFWEVERDSISRHVAPGYPVKSIAWPFHLHDRRMLEIAREEGYLAGRNGGLDWATLKRGQLASWDSCRIYEIGLTMADDRLVADEVATRAYVRSSVIEGIEHGNCWINLYTHTTDGRYTGGNGVSRQELVWAIDELKRSGLVWIGSMAEVATYYRAHHVPSPQDPLLWILGENAPPVAGDDTAALAEDGSAAVPVLANDFDPEGRLNAASLEMTQPPAHGLAVVVEPAGTIAYTPAPDYNGPDGFRYRVADAEGGLSNEATVSIQVLSLNDPPVARDDTAFTSGQDSVSIDVLANDSDIDGVLVPASVVIVSPPAGGLAAVDPATGRIVYTAPGGFTDSDSLTYSVGDDSLALSAPARVRITPNDVTPPGAVAGLAAAPGAGTVRLSWSAPVADASALEIWRSRWRGPAGQSAYPLYDDLEGAWLPVVPSSRASAAADSLWTLVTSLAADATAWEDTIPERGAYEYTLFARDPSGNYGPPSAPPSLATNYFLGDLPSSGDGIVAGGEFAALGAAYGLARGDAGFDPELDIGPTSDGTGTGVPLTDGVIDFEDYMILSQNYADGAPTAGSGTVGAAPVLIGLRWIDERTLALDLLAPCPWLKGLHLRAALPPSEAPSVSLSIRSAKSAVVLSALNDRSHGLDLGVVALGAGLGYPGGGELCRLAFARPVVLEALTLQGRGLANQPLACSVSQVTGIPDRHPASLGPNSPNPFNPSTVIPFVLPRAGRARLDVYGLDGHHVTTLVDGELPAGAHAVVWSGGDGRGRGVASGLYVCRLRFGDVLLTRRMTLVK